MEGQVANIPSSAPTPLPGHPPPSLHTTTAQPSIQYNFIKRRFEHATPDPAPYLEAIPIEPFTVDPAMFNSTPSFKHAEKQRLATSLLDSIKPLLMQYGAPTILSRSICAAQPHLASIATVYLQLYNLHVEAYASNKPHKEAILAFFHSTQPRANAVDQFRLSAEETTALLKGGAKRAQYSGGKPRSNANQRSTTDPPPDSGGGRSKGTPYQGKGRERPAVNPFLRNTIRRNKPSKL